jgi:hypothetical protein
MKLKKPATKTSELFREVYGEDGRVTQKHSHKMTSGEVSRVERLVWRGVWLMMKITLKRITCTWNGLANQASKPVYVLTSHLPCVIDNCDNITILTVYETVWVLKYKQMEPLF